MTRLESLVLVAKETRDCCSNHRLLVGWEGPDCDGAASVEASLSSGPPIGWLVEAEAEPAERLTDP